MTVLITGYEPFGDHQTNPSATIAKRLDGRTITDHDLVGRVLPVEYDRASEEIAGLIDEHHPSVVLSTGLAPETTCVQVERVGININDCMGVPDNDDAEPRNEAIVDGPDAYFASLPVPAVVSALLDAGIPARLSNTAGTHLCNNALYTTRHLVETQDLDVRSGFIHVPFTPQQAAENARDQEGVSGGEVPPSLPLDLQIEAIETTVSTVLDNEL